MSVTTTIARTLDPALRCECCASGCDCGCVLECPVHHRFPPPREMTDADMDRVHAECQQAGREMREITAPMVAPEKGRAR